MGRHNNVLMYNTDYIEARAVCALVTSSMLRKKGGSTERSSLPKSDGIFPDCGANKSLIIVWQSPMHSRFGPDRHRNNKLNFFPTDQTSPVRGQSSVYGSHRESLSLGLPGK
ncbi:hypothetical protein NDA11_006781 [Ustilago hordei]|uniref:Uncharacterized protein n=1 Tax=Ustilago hordei TaxID=120017 RepID=I2G1M8_USTHO|nr:uncharacterized protein UHO2_02457 [Ustilago hordei]KAJ1040125.1 hypothetical protein NDA10_005552 [Ustilago hordei]KAJ1585130.1 hypothetical protein NDA15_003194 [Ustilago hordei]KAJ1588468.1 hypothetical protein NDA12_007707 [Ustilago hordei]KAJ1593279.1 hypothetical protein NDA11_006781 [Ustilago hordei]KAJ1601632.1 hypothetical protein NDA14_004762 [Ustilago hordei]